MNTSEQHTLFDLDTPSGKTFPASYQPPTMLSDVSSLPLSVLMKPLKLKKGGQVQAWSADLRDEPRGAFWMLNGSAWPNDACACSLSSVLETGPIPAKYYLSARACLGILRRAEKRGKALPTALRAALEQVAGASAGEARVEDKAPLLPSLISDSPSTQKAGGGRIDGESETFVAHSLRADGFDASEDGTGRGTPLVPVANSLNGNSGRMQIEATYVPLQEVGKRTGASTTDPRAGIGIGGEGDPMYNLQAGAQHGVAISFHGTQDPCANYGDTAPTIGCNQGQEACIAYNLRGRDGGAMPEPTDVASIRAASGGSSRTYVGVRRLTPTECERLQGFPDGYTAIPFRGKPAADGPRYKALGNAMAVPVMEWIGRRIIAAEGGKR